MALTKDASGPSSFWLKLRSPRAPRTYIVPTAFGLVFGLLSFILLLFAIGSGNNLVYIYTFFLISIAHTSMILTNNNVRRLSVDASVDQFLFAKQRNQLEIEIRNTGKKTAQDLEVLLSKKDLEKIPIVDPMGLIKMSLSFVPDRRGEQPAPRITIQSHFPFGLLRAWKHSRPEQMIYVFPEPRGSSKLPDELLAAKNSQAGTAFRGHREYSPTDSIRRIDWKASAKSDLLHVKEYESESSFHYTFSPNHVAHLPSIEDKLSQITLWLLECEEQKIRYGFQFQFKEAKPAFGARHLREILVEILQLSDEQWNSSWKK